MTIPANTLLFRSEGLRVAVVRDGRAELVPVTLGRDYGRSVEVVAGLQAARRGDPRSRRLAGQRRPRPRAADRAPEAGRDAAGREGAGRVAAARAAGAAAGRLACQRATSSPVVNHTPRDRRM